MKLKIFYTELVSWSIHFLRTSIFTDINFLAEHIDILNPGFVISFERELIKSNP